MTLGIGPGQTGQHLVAHLRREIRALTVVGGGQDVLHLAAQGGVVAVARHIDHAGDETFEGIVAHEERGALTLLQVQHADGDLVQLLHRDLEQLVARIGLEDVDERFR